MMVRYSLMTRIVWTSCVLVFVAGPALSLETISGTVSAASGGAFLANVDLDVFDATGHSVTITGGKTNVSGFYTVTLPGPGSYTIRADATLSSGFVDQFYPGSFLHSQASPLSVAVGQAISGIDFSLAAGVTLSGTVRSSVDNSVLGGIDMDLLSATGEVLSGCPGTTDVNGNFTMGVLPPGDFILRADPDPVLGQYFVRTYYGGQIDRSLAASITVESTPVTGLDISVGPGGVLAGSVKDSSSAQPVAGSDIDVYDALGDRMEVFAKTDVNGSYSIGCVPPGSYTVRAVPGALLGYPSTYYPSVYNQADASLVAVTAGNVTSGIDFLLPLGGRISGRILESSLGQGLEGIDLDLFDAQSNRVDVTAATDANGQYALEPLAPGNYLLRADPSLAQGYPRTYYPDTGVLGNAQWISVAGGADTAHIDFLLPRGGTIAGTIFEADGTTPLGDVDLDCFDVLGNRIDITGKSDVNGAYMLGILAPGSYALKADPPDATGLAEQYYQGKVDVNLADPIAVSADTQTSGIDFSLSAGGWIEGTVTDVDTGQPLNGIDLDLYDAAAGTRLRASTASDSLGQYKTSLLQAGTYLLRCDPAADYAVLYYQGKPRLLESDPIAVAQGAGTSAIDFALPAGMVISGRITSDGVTPLAGVDIDVLTANTWLKFDQSAVSGADGSYTVHGLAAGTYLVRGDPGMAIQYVDTYYGGSSDRSLAVPVSLSNGQDRTDIDITLLSGEGEGEPVLEGEGEPVAEGEGEGGQIIEGEGERPVEGEGEGEAGNDIHGKARRILFCGVKGENENGVVGDLAWVGLMAAVLTMRSVSGIGRRKTALFGDVK